MSDRVMSHPGEVLLQDFLIPYNMNMSSFAVRIGVTANRITQIVNGKRSITPETAILFAAAFGTSVEFWMNLQSNHDLSKANIKPERIANAQHLYVELMNRGE